MAEGGHDNVQSIGRIIRQRNRTLDWEGIDVENLRKLKQARSCKKSIVMLCQQQQQQQQ